MPQTAIRDFSVRFAALTQVGERIRCTGRVTELFQADGERRARLAIQTANEAGVIKLQGEAIMALLRYPTLPDGVLQGRLRDQELPPPTAAL